MAVILGTAGHIDHGKTTLINALTGIDCDRLAEEKKRGITIELGFAWLDLPNQERLGIIDVPGHEKFVHNMVAGACGLDFVMLVIAADEGVMPQTREHLEICSLLGLKRGLIALTKIDLVDADWLNLVQEEIKTELTGSFLKNAPIYPVSVRTKQGLDNLKTAIISLAKDITKENTSDLFRLPIDRVFTIKGHGTVVTGTVLAGKVSVGDTLEIMPSGLETRARSIERHEEEMAEISFGSRCAINLQNLEKSQLERGQIVAKKGELYPERHWYVLLEHLPSAKNPLKNRQEIHFHHGTKELPARIVLRQQATLEPGSSSFAEVLFNQEMCGVFNDHAVIRSGSPLRTIAGCQILSPIPPALRSKANKDPLLHSRYLKLPHLYQEALQDLKKASAPFVLEVLDLLGLPGATLNKLRVATALNTRTLEQALKTLLNQGQIIVFDRENPSYLAKTHLLGLKEKLLARAKELHDLAPLKPSFARQALFSGWGQDLPPKLLTKLLDICIKDGQISPEGEGLRLSSHKVTLAGQDEDLAQKISQAYTKTPLTPPNFKDVLADLQKTAKEVEPILTHLLASGQLVKVKDGLYYSREGLTDILDRVRTWFLTHDNLDIAALKSILPLSRKYLVALLEYMDNAHITVRVGDQRRLRQTSA